MIVLGVGLQHDSGAALVADGQILAAVNEERLNRRKMFWGWPLLAVQEVLDDLSGLERLVGADLNANHEGGIGVRWWTTAHATATVASREGRSYASAVSPEGR